MKPLLGHARWQGLAFGVLLAVSAHLPASANALTVTSADSAGPGTTMALQLGSPAIDQVILNAATCSGTDQRGFVRPLGARCDIGAIEMDLDKLFRNGFD